MCIKNNNHPLFSECAFVFILSSINLTIKIDYYISTFCKSDIQTYPFKL